MTYETHEYNTTYRSLLRARIVVDADNHQLLLLITDDAEGTQYTEPMHLNGWEAVNDRVLNCAYFRNRNTGQVIPSEGAPRALGSLDFALTPEENEAELERWGW